MDIDFHYFATYAAARFAGLDGRRALTIATSAQMIDENALGVVGGSGDNLTWNYFRKIPIKAHDKGPTLLDYQLIQSFQSVADIPTNDKIAYKSYWPVFHFLPGNFKPRNVDPRFESPLWTPRTFSSQCEKHTQHRDDYFKWLTRPYSPMAIALINNCRALVHDAQSDINKFGLADYLIGVTMHVFIDTWAHQDFVGYTSKLINGANGEPTFRYENYPDAKEGKWDGSGKVGAVARWNEASAWLGHGPVGHWPDHSAVIFDYTPGWSARPITRNNPAEYESAFVNMVHAMRCIVNNEPYLPISRDEALRRIPVGPLFNQQNLNKIKGLISYRRNPDGGIVGASIPKIKIPTGRDIATLWTKYDAWDKNMYFFNSVWINTLIDIFQEVGDNLNDFPLTHWVPGKSEWVDQANSATKKSWLTPSEFLSLDYFKFNVAAKFHYRFVEQQLKAFGEELIGDWPVGFAYANDLSALEGAGSVVNKEKTDILGKLRDLQRTVVKSDVREGLTVLIGEVQLADSGTEARAILHRGLSLVDARERSWSYGLITNDGNISDQQTVQTLRRIAGPIVAGETAVPKLRDAVNIALQQYKKESSGFFRRSSTESKAAEQRLIQLVATNDAELEDALNYLMGRTPLRPSILRDDPDCRPIKSDGRLYKLLEEALRTV
jgi:hypothetical protein